MTKAASSDGLTKFQRYRQARIRRGMRLLRVWVLDPKSPEFQAAAARQSSVLRGVPEDAEALGFIGAAADWPDA